MKFLLDDAAQRSRSIDRVIPLSRKPTLRRLVDLKRDLALLQHMVELAQLNLNDPLHVRPRKALEQQNFVDAV